MTQGTALVLSVQSDIDRATAFLADVHRRHIPFATVKALTDVARLDAKPAAYATMQRVFDRPTPYTLNALRAMPATRTTMKSEVGFKDFAGKGTPARKYLLPNILGGGRVQKSHERQLAHLLGSTFLIPGAGLKRNSYGNVQGSVFTRILSHLGAQRDSAQNVTNSKRSLKKRSNDVYFIAGGKVMHRKGKNVSVALVPIRAPRYRQIFPFYETVHEAVAANFYRRFETSMQQSIATSNYRGRWQGVGG